MKGCDWRMISVLLFDCVSGGLGLLRGFFGCFVVVALREVVLWWAYKC